MNWEKFFIFLFENLFLVLNENWKKENLGKLRNFHDFSLKPFSPKLEFAYLNCINFKTKLDDNLSLPIT